MLTEEEEVVIDDTANRVVASGCGLNEALAEFERAIIHKTLIQAGGNRSIAARKLGLPRQTLQDRLKRHGLWLDVYCAAPCLEPSESRDPK
jgi:DNA-binding NtrC family response regulator